GHVLPDEHSEPVAVVIEPRGFDLHVLAKHIEAELLRHFNVVSECFIGRRRVETIGPPTLIEWAEHEDRLAIEMEAVDAFSVFGERDFAETDVAGDFIAFFISYENRNL